ncbi:hypothetical protein MHC_01085 [Mycoplasma haemocanis str. Illinois]|uniref:Uncharacterized protein n=1 Tax=Mycoplasma haemocanis (strain Illinois) TaxID=1111676 RepID=H6N611_MYCHN|nr:hypothetical protein [Mycoplasma haemocanis]AEW45083.1 hypothetical protein MHC_01085 [Mycoplasma haemocanis str. Illinois]
MPTSLLTKVALGTLGVGTVATGSVYLGKGLIISKTKISIEDLIDKFNPEKRFISFGDNHHWNEAWKAYREGNKDLWNISKITSTSTTSAPKEFMDACDSKKSQEVLDKSDPLYSQVVKYCTRDTLVRDLINENEDRSLLEKGHNFKGDGDWKTVWDLYKNDNSGSSDKWAINTWSSIKSETNAPAAFADMCIKRSEVKAHDLANPDYLDVLKYCTK